MNSLPSGHVFVIGLDSGTQLTPKIAEIISQAQVVAGPSRFLQEFIDLKALIIPLTGKLEPFLQNILELSQTQQIVVLASGDPNFYGIAKRLLQTIPSERITILPGTTTIQKAFAKLKTTWADVPVVSLHGREGFRTFFAALYRAGRMDGAGYLAVYTDSENTPGVIAQKILDRHFPQWEMYVFEDLDSQKEKVSLLSLAEAQKTTFSPLNLVVLHKSCDFIPLTLGSPESLFNHEAAMITKSEIRVNALGLLDFRGNETLWDIGAGSGSVSLEAAILLPYGEVIGVEKNPQRILQAISNRTRFGIPHVDFIQGEAQEILPSLPTPDRVFFGGGGADLAALIEIAKKRLSPNGIIVASVISLASLEEAVRALTGPTGAPPEVIQLAVARSQKLADSFYFKPLNQVYLVKGQF